MNTNIFQSQIDKFDDDRYPERSTHNLRSIVEVCQKRKSTCLI